MVMIVAAKMIAPTPMRYGLLFLRGVVTHGHQSALVARQPHFIVQGRRVAGITPVG